MGVWNVSITGNDTAQDLRADYAAAFSRYDAEEALQKIDDYVRTQMFDESDAVEWCSYIYSLAEAVSYPLKQHTHECLGTEVSRH